ncbi:MAG: YjgB family protein [Firmicutes bacterium]|nr:YjgB family protein [Bacillota bacterium]
MKKKHLIMIAFFLLASVLAAGCAATTNNTSNPPPASNNQPSVPGNDNPNQKLIANITTLAQQGKIINSEFPVKTTTIDEVEKKLGPADTATFVAAAKGTYSAWAQYQVAFGWNKGMQIFEARSFDSRLKNITLADIKLNLGSPAYDVKSNGQEIIGYYAGTEYKLLLVWAQTTDVNPNPHLDHYSVLYPAGTVNSMADDPGRQW